MDRVWERRGSMLRSTTDGEMLLCRDGLRKLVDAFLEMSREEQRGVAIRVVGPDWTREYGDSEIMELAARPDYHVASDDEAAEAGARSDKTRGVMVWS